MSKAGLNRSFDRSSVNFPPTVEPKASQTEALLREAINTAKPPRLRPLLQDLCNRPPDPRTVTAALLIITGERFKKLEQSDESDTKKEDNGDEDSKDEAASKPSNEEEDDSESEIALEDSKNGNDHGSSDDEENEASDGKIARKDNEVKHPTESSNDENEYSESELANNDTAYKRVLETDGSRDGLTGRKGDKKTGDQDHEHEGSADAYDSECNLRNTGSEDENGTEPSDDEPEDFGSDEGSDRDNTDESSETSSAPQHARHRHATSKMETKLA